VTSYVRSLSGPANEKFPQTNQVVQELGLTYKVISDISDSAYYAPLWTNYNDPVLVNNRDTNEMILRSNYWVYAKNLQANLHDVRLIFRWPILPNGSVGNGRQVFRTMVGGQILATNDNGYPPNLANLFLFEPRAYVKAP
jgi:hypothetical protein